MGSWGSADFKELKEFQKQLEQMESQREHLCERCSKALAGRVLRLAVKDTPTGEKPEIKDVVGNEKNEKIRVKKLEEYHKIWDGYEGGTLKRSWTVSPVNRAGHNYTIEVINPVEYASYVEFGHRQTPGRYVPAIGKKLANNFTEKKYMLTNAETVVKIETPNILERELKKFFKEVFDE